MQSKIKRTILAVYKCINSVEICYKIKIMMVTVMIMTIIDIIRMIGEGRNLKDMLNQSLTHHLIIKTAMGMVITLIIMIMIDEY